MYSDCLLSTQYLKYDSKRNVTASFPVSQKSCHSTLWHLYGRKEAVKYKQEANKQTAASLFHMEISHRPRNVHPVAFISFSEFLLVQDSELLCRTVTFCDRKWLNPLNPKLNPICYLLALLPYHFLHVSRIRDKSLTLWLLMSYIYDIGSL